MSPIFLSIGILALVFSFIMALRSLSILEKRITHVEDDIRSHDILLSLSFTDIGEIKRKQNIMEGKITTAPQEVEALAKN